MVFLQDDRFFLVLYFVFMLLFSEEDLWINVCSWFFNSMNMVGENQLSAQSSCVLLGLAALGCVQLSCWELTWSHEGRTYGSTEPEAQSGTGVAWTMLAEGTQNISLLYSKTESAMCGGKNFDLLFLLCVFCQGSGKQRSPKQWCSQYAAGAALQFCQERAKWS